MRCSAVLIVLIALELFVHSTATYTSEEEKENSKSSFSGFSTIQGSLENNREHHKHTYDAPPMGHNANNFGFAPTQTYNQVAPGDVNCQESGCHYPKRPQGGYSARPETEEIDYTKAQHDILDPNAITNGAGKLDVRSGNPSSRPKAVVPIGAPSPYPPYRILGGVPGSSGYDSNAANVYSPQQGTHAQGGYVTSQGGYGAPVGYSAPAGFIPPQGSYAPPQAYYPPQHGIIYPPSQGYYNPHASHGENHGHGHDHYHHHGNRGYSITDHSLKTNTEYNESGHHEGPFRAPNIGDGYNGAFNRPGF